MKIRCVRQRRVGRKGFTLVELIVVLVILGILAAIMVPSLIGWIDKAKNQDAILECRNVVMAAQGQVAEEYAKGTLTSGSKVISDASILDEILKLAGVSEKGKINGEITLNDLTVSTLVYEKNGITVKYEKDSTPRYWIDSGASNSTPTNGKEYHDSLVDWMDKEGYLNEDGTVKKDKLDSETKNDGGSLSNDSKVLQEHYKELNGKQFPKLEADSKELNDLKDLLGDRYREAQLVGKVWKPVVTKEGKVIMALSNNDENGAAKGTSIVYYEGSYYAWMHGDSKQNKIDSTYIGERGISASDLSSPEKQWVKLN